MITKEYFQDLMIDLKLEDQYSPDQNILYPIIEYAEPLDKYAYAVDLLSLQQVKMWALIIVDDLINLTE